MEIDITTPALLFPAISLLLLAYTNRFMTLARIVRELASEFSTHNDERVRLQIDNLRLRINLIKWMQAIAIGSFLLCVVSMICLFSDQEIAGRIIFGISMALIILSLLLSLWETLLSGTALKHELDRCAESAKKDSKKSEHKPNRNRSSRRKKESQKSGTPKNSTQTAPQKPASREALKQEEEEWEKKRREWEKKRGENS